MKKILIPTDFSAHSKNAIRYVVNFLQEANVPCQLLLLNTYMVQHTDPKDVISINDELKKKSKVGLEVEKQEAMKIISNPRVTVETASHLGTLGNVIMQFIEKEEIGMVAMGKDGGKNVENISALLKRMACPLLITYLKE